DTSKQWYQRRVAEAAFFFFFKLKKLIYLSLFSIYYYEYYESFSGCAFVLSGYILMICRLRCFRFVLLSLD
ncbi:hypothetical protein PLESHI_08909, partial [Plesiomonas shigelloides 302-73]